MLNTYDRFLDFVRAFLNRDVEGMKSVVQSAECGVSRIDVLGDEMSVNARRGTISGRVNAIAGLEAYAIGRSLALLGLSYARNAQQLLQPKSQANQAGLQSEQGGLLGAPSPPSLNLSEAPVPLTRQRNHQYLQIGGKLSRTFERVKRRPNQLPSRNW